MNEIQRMLLLNYLNDNNIKYEFDSNTQLYLIPLI